MNNYTVLPTVTDHRWNSYDVAQSELIDAVLTYCSYQRLTILDVCAIVRGVTINTWNRWIRWTKGSRMATTEMTRGYAIRLCMFADLDPDRYMR